MRPSSSLENKIPADIFLRVHLVYMKFEAQISSESPQEHNQDQIPLTNQSWLWSYLPNWELCRYYISSFGLVLEGKLGKEIQCHQDCSSDKIV